MIVQFVSICGESITIRIPVPTGFKIVDFRTPEIGDYYLDANYLQIKECRELIQRGYRFIVVADSVNVEATVNMETINNEN